jgi:hypothetical protein
MLPARPDDFLCSQTVTFAVTGQPTEVHMKVAGLASRPGFLELRSGTGDRLTIIPGAVSAEGVAAYRVSGIGFCRQHVTLGVGLDLSKAVPLCRQLTTC